MAFIFNTTIPLNELPTPLILLSPHEVHNVLLSTYIHLGTFSVWNMLHRWDFVNCLTRLERRYWSGMSSITLGTTGDLFHPPSKDFLPQSISQLGIFWAPVRQSPN